MASAKFLEEALSTEVDESAVTALVGTLETQLVTATPTVSSQQVSSTSVNQNHMSSSIANGGTVSTQKHGVTNGGSGPMNILLNSDTNKTITSNAISNTSNVHSNVSSVVASMHGGVPASGYINQVTTSQPNLTHLSKPQESVKIVYPTTIHQLSSGTPNLNNRVTFTGASLPNGNIGLAPITTQTIVNAVTSGVQSVVSHTPTPSGNNVNKHISGVIGVDSNKTGGAALVIKTNTNPIVTQTTQIGTGVVSVPMTVNSTVTMTGTHVNSTVSTSAPPGMSGVVTLAKPVTHAVGTTQAIVGNNPTALLPANVQIVNVNAVRPATPGQPGQKTLPSRVVIGTQHMVGARPGQPITLQALQGLQPGTQGHLILKTENGQFQLLRVGPPPTQGSTINPNNSNNATLPTGGTFRLQTLPAQPGTVTVATTPNPSSSTTQPQTQTTVQQTSVSSMPNQTPTQKNTMETTKEKCRKFLANLLELSSREPKSVEKNVRTLIQELIDTKVEPEEFCDRLERLLNASPQPCLIGFLKKSLPLLRQSLVTKELVIEGIRPPPHTVVFSLANSTNVPQIQQAQIRSSQVRLVTPLAASQGITTVARPGQTIQHRLVTPVRAQTPTPRMVTGTNLRPHSPITSVAQTGLGSTAGGIKVTSTLQTGSNITTGVGSINTAIPAPPLHIRQTTQVVRPLTPVSSMAVGLNAGATSVKHLPGNMQIKTTVTPTHIKLTNLAQTKQLTTASILAKSIKQEKKSFSTSGYSGEDDINDVAAMGGVNLAEETQRILGSTEFVGTQIRSCKDEIFLHSSPLQQKIRFIVAKHGLEEPTQDVAALISHACQERLKNLLEKLAIIAEHRIDLIKMDPRYEVTQDVKGQLKFLEELDKVERKKHEEQEREMLLRAAKSRSKSEDPEQAKLKAKAKEMQRAEMEELRQREANLTALQAIGPRKKSKLDFSNSSGSSSQTSGLGVGFSSNHNRYQLPSRPRFKRVNFRDLLFLLEQEKETCRTPLLYKSFLK